MPALPLLTVAVLTAVGVGLRLVVAHQSLFADELSTYWIVASRGLGDVISTVHTDAEISPPLSFVATWLATRIELAPELMRAPSLVAGTATIPLVYLVGRKTVGQRAALVATAFTALAPFMVYYSAEARGYALMVALVLLSTLALLSAIDSGRTRWWVLYGVCACAAVYSHYTGVFALGAQLLWALLAHPEARRPVLLASAAAAVGFAPWLSGLRGDLDSPTTDILSALQPFTLENVRISVTHWAIGYPYATPISRMRDLPGVPALAMLALAVVPALAAVTGAALRGRARPDARLVLVGILALSVPAGEAVASMLGSNLFGTRNLAASWPAFALCLAALLVGAGPRLGAAAVALAIGAFAIGAVKLLDPDFSRPDYRGVAAFIERTAGRGDVIVDGASLSPAGVTTGLEAAFERRPRIFQIGRDEVAYDPFRILALAPPTADVIREAAAAAGAKRLFLVVISRSPSASEAIRALPARYRRVAVREYRGINPLRVLVYESQTAIGA